MSSPSEPSSSYTAPPPPKSVVCQGCKVLFSSRNLMFKHLRETNGVCLEANHPTEFQQFRTYLQSRQRVKCVLLVGYLPSYLGRDHDQQQQKQEAKRIVRNGDDAVDWLFQAIGQVDSCDVAALHKGGYHRSYGSSSRDHNEFIKQDPDTSARAELICTKLLPLADTNSAKELSGWIDRVNQSLETLLKQQKQKNQLLDNPHDVDTAQIRVLGRLTMPHKKFHAEMDLSHRRVEYLVPVDFFYSATNNTTIKTRDEFQDWLPSFMGGSGAIHQQDMRYGYHVTPDTEALNFLHTMKRRMQRLTTQIVPLDQSEEGTLLSTQQQQQGVSTKKRKRPKQSQMGTNAKDKTQEDHSATATATTSSSKSNGEDDAVKNGTANDASKDTKPPNISNSKLSSKKKAQRTHVLQRRRFHNFTPKLMAHDFLAYRRVDRFFHRATIRIDGRCYIKLSITGDMFLHGQVCRIIGLLMAITRGVVDDERDLLDCIFDESYTHLFPTPPAPSIGMIASEFNYMQWEGRVKLVLTPRQTAIYPNGWSDDQTLARLNDWEQEIYNEIAKGWTREGIDEDGRLVAERKWTETVLVPWATRAQRQLQEYRHWKQVECSKELSKSLETLDCSVPDLYENTLRLLREADASGLWPSTSPKRQLVMVSNNKEGHNTSLAIKHMKAKSNFFQDSNSNNSSSSTSAYAFEEGEGGASGSFSVGAMPGGQCAQPKANSIFPELMKAAFELEMALCPHREPSSTIAINRNAQFRPHTDSGAGAGQSTSLIVGIGNYTGGELVVEGEKHSIRYKAKEFNGWKQRHWTMPFRGERFSLVWFTPKGCEGIRGIDLCK